MIAEFDWWLLIVGLGAGAAVTWLILVDLGRRDQDLSERERTEEVSWMEAILAKRSRPTSPETIRRVLELHAAYLARSVPPEPETDAASADAAPVPDVSAASPGSGPG